MFVSASVVLVGFPTKQRSSSVTDEAGHSIVLALAEGKRLESGNKSIAHESNKNKPNNSEIKIHIEPYGFENIPSFPGSRKPATEFGSVGPIGGEPHPQILNGIEQHSAATLADGCNCQGDG